MSTKLGKYYICDRCGTTSFFEKIGGAYNLSYTDVYDFCSTKQSLKKWEIELGLSGSNPWHGKFQAALPCMQRKV